MEEAARVCGVDAEQIRLAAEMYAKGTPSSIFYTLGITEHTCGTENVQNMANLAMLCGQIGKPSSGVNPLRGQNNVQGGCDMGAIHSVFPGYQKVSDPAAREKFAKAWGVEIPTNTGGRVTDFIEQAHAGVLKGLYVLGEDPVLSEPNQDQGHRELEEAGVSRGAGDIPDRDRQAGRRGAARPPVSPRKTAPSPTPNAACNGSAKPSIRPAKPGPIGRLSATCPRPWATKCATATPRKSSPRWPRSRPVLAGISYERIEKTGLQWPCPTTDHPGTVFLHQERFTRGNGLLHVIHFRPPAEVPDQDYPFMLSTGRTLFHYNIGNMTRKSAAIRQKEDENFVEIHADDARRLGIAAGGLVRVTTRRGSLAVRAHVADKVRPGAIWMPFHFAENSTNQLTNDAFDNITRTGEYKCCAAKLEKIETPIA